MKISNARISVLSFNISGQDQYNNSEDMTLLPVGAFIEIVNLTFTPSTSGNYLFLATAEVNSTASITGDIETELTQFKVDNNIIASQAVTVNLETDIKPFAAHRVLFLTNTSHNATIEAKSDITDSVDRIARARILALRLTDFYPFSQSNSTSVSINPAGDNSFIEKVNLTYTPPFEADNLIFVTADTREIGTTGGKRIEAVLRVDGVERSRHVYRPVSGSDFVPFGQHKNISLNTTSSHTLLLLFKNVVGSTQDAIIQNAAISIIIPDTFPPVVTASNIFVKNGSLVALNATITDLGSGVKNATVNVSAINSTINTAILTNTSGFWVNSSIIADKGETNGFMNLTVTAYDNTSNVNNSGSIPVWIDATPPTKVVNFTNTTVPSHISVEVSWNASTDNASGINKYQIERTNDSFNFLTVPRNVINASNILTGYEKDAYWYTFKNVAPVDCSTCHGSARPNVGNIFTKYNQSYLYIAIHAPDNDTSTADDTVGLAFDVNMNGGSAPNFDDRLYHIAENNTLTSYTGNGSVWVVNSTNANSSVNGSGTKAPWYEIRIPLSEIGNPVNNTSINFMFEVETSDSPLFVSKGSSFPAEAIETNPST